MKIIFLSIAAEIVPLGALRARTLIAARRTHGLPTAEWMETASIRQCKGMQVGSVDTAAYPLSNPRTPAPAACLT